MHNYKSWLASNKIGSLILLVLFCFTAQAAVNVDKTRIIFNSKDKEKVVVLSNDSTTPMVIQVWTDDGDINSQPDTTTTPILALPPVFKMVPNELKSVRLILSSRNDLPSDKESVYWLNIFQIPPTNSVVKADERQIVLPLRLRLKTFVRPIGMNAPTNSDYQQLTFSIENNQLIVKNPTTWFVSFAVTLSDENIINNLMIAPKSDLAIPVNNDIKAGQNIIYSVINDNGNRVEFTSTLK